MADYQPVAVIARVLDLSERQVYELARRGIIPRAGRGKFEVFACNTAYIRHLREMAAGRSSADGGHDLVAERARLAKEQADEKAMKNAVTRAELVPAADIEASRVAVHSIVMRKLLAIPRAIARKLARENEARACEAIVRAELYQALKEISSTELEVSFEAEAPASGD